MKDKVSIKNVIKFAGAYIAFVIGSGFATGQEIIQFFGAYGKNGIYAALISMFLFAFIGATVMVKGKELNLDVDTEIFDYYVGKKLGKVLSILTVVFLFSVVSIMIAGTGAIFAEYFNLSHIVGKIFMAVLVLTTVMFGLNKLTDIIGTIGPFIIVFTVAIGVCTIAKFNGTVDFTAPVYGELFEKRATANTWFSSIKSLDSFISSGILYASCMILGGVPFLASLGKKANSKKEAAFGGILGGVLLMVPVIIMVFAILLYPEEIIKLEVPTLFLAKKSLPIIAPLFSIVVLMGVYSTATPMFSIVTNKASEIKIIKNQNMLKIVLIIVAYFGSGIGFGKLIGILYPFVGQIGFLMIIIIIGKAILQDRRNVKTAVDIN